MTRAATLMVFVVVGCAPGAEPPPEPYVWPDAIPAEPQREGDPDAGYDAFVNEGYISCGIPWSVFEIAVSPATPEELIPGRTGRNAEIAYNWTAFTTEGGVDLVSSNCMACHAGRINGELVVGLGNASADYTSVPEADMAPLVEQFAQTEAEKAEARRWARSVTTIAPYLQTHTRGANPADNMAAILMAHRDRETLAWSDEPLIETPPYTDGALPMKVPPLWRVAKKNALFATGGARGDQVRGMILGTLLCSEEVAEVEWVDELFVDVRAWMMELEPPAWPWGIDDDLAADGEAVFEATCSECHGTYGANAHYPNRLIDADDVGTDNELVGGGGQFADHYVDWYNDSVYGELSRATSPTGYMPPPLDGIWATAPFLHNGSVPTLRALLDPSSRPTYWVRSFLDDDYDTTDVGWNHDVWEHGHADEDDEYVRKRLLDTTLWGYANGGHLYGEDLTEDERDALLEYLKTL